MEQVDERALQRLPRALREYLTYGLAGLDERQRRSQLTANLFSLLASSNALFFVCLYFLIDASLWPAAIVGTVFALAVLPGPAMFRRSPAISSVYMTILSGVQFPLLTHFLGLGSGLYLFMLTTPSVSLTALGASRMKLAVFQTILAVSVVVASALYFGEAALPAAEHPVPQAIFLISTVATTAGIILLTAYDTFQRAERAENALEAEHARSEALLHNLLPAEIAARLKVEPDRTIADSLPQVAILFADIVNFTPRSAKMRPEEIVDFLNRVFSAFDELAEKHGLEKIKTIGDAYMVAAGMPNPCGDPVHRMAEMALDMLRVTADLPDGVEVRIGLHAGPAVAGVIGNQKLFYDVWGETVNTASRMESHGEPGRIQVTGPAREELTDTYTFEARGAVEVKGMGLVETWWLTGKATAG